MQHDSETTDTTAGRTRAKGDQTRCLQRARLAGERAAWLNNDRVAMALAAFAAPLHGPLGDLGDRRGHLR
jgi:hypothetical protein